MLAYSVVGLELAIATEILPTSCEGMELAPDPLLAFQVLPPSVDLYRPFAELPLEFPIAAYAMSPFVGSNSTEVATPESTRVQVSPASADRHTPEDVPAAESEVVLVV